MPIHLKRLQKLACIMLYVTKLNTATAIKQRPSQKKKCVAPLSLFQAALKRHNHSLLEQFGMPPIQINGSTKVL